MKILLFIVALYIFYRLLKTAWRVFTRPDWESGKGRPNGKIMDEMVQDPVCKIYIPRREAVNKKVDGSDFFFCSRECADKFDGKTRE